ncbi:MAG: UDP-N-acetylglucosamine diphosphorylase [Verrucomicrobiales bacterium]|jgi:NDP-sugar pyrophosphorylase family protein|nr:UDP-N-acetylglucosamine diphosphorylase [Verrucomicrobiales bacterium]HQZ27788.1 UDP-N-acetylglucosamine diphosphorylase [Verrucomicrobiales bacterium]
MKFCPEDFFDFSETDHADLFRPGEAAWAALPRIEAYLAEKLNRVGSETQQGQVHERAIVGDRVYLAPGSRVEANAVIKGPAWIGRGTVIRSGAYLRENVVVGDHCVLGNSSEFKNCLLFNRCEIPHYDYVGDSILGYKAHLGAGVICSNVRLDRRLVTVREENGERIETGLPKFGAIIGDRTEVGCQTVLGPGTILGRDCILHPLVSWTGVLESGRIVKNRMALEIGENRNL